MDVINETSSITCRFLSEDHFSRLHETFLEAFSDYEIPFPLSTEQLRNHIALNAVDLNLSVGCFAGEKMVGFTLNGFGMWNGKATVYDAGTGVIPPFRRRGLGRAMFDFMFPVCQARGVEQCLLEVITSNEKAANLYKGLGFRQNRKLLLLKTENPVKFTRKLPENIEVRKISRLDWELFQTFWDGQPSWQNSAEAIKRGPVPRNMLGAFSEGKCIGYIIFSLDTGRLAQLAVDKSKRGRGTGTLLLTRMQAETKDGYPLQVINLDESLTEALRFFQNRGFSENLSQYEMIKQL
jgi:ribosomal protein S18 acetylase RimI-like enzyme